MLSIGDLLCIGTNSAVCHQLQTPQSISNPFDVYISQLLASQGFDSSLRGAVQPIQVAVRTRPWRQTDAGRYPSLHAAHRWVTGEVERLAPIDPVEILADLVADTSAAQVHKAAGLALAIC